MSAGGPGDGLLVAGEIEGSGYHITIDTGSDVSILRSDVLGTHLKHLKTPVEDCISLRMVTGHTSPIKHRVGVRLQLGSLTTRHDFYLADIVDDCILGMDYLKPTWLFWTWQSRP